MQHLRQLAFTTAWLAAGIGVGATAEIEPSFNRDIRPILSDRCFACHGPDSGNREAELRLDDFEGATEWAIVPHDSSQSEVISRISDEDPDLKMPPPDSNRKPLTANEIELLRRWIDAGAKYEPHWSYVPPRRTSIPDVDRTDWNRSPIDQFLLAKMQLLGITPSTDADRVALIRRLHLDITGLPPTPAAVERFVADERDDAVERLVDRLLSSPAYGERMASWWFDLVRFANTVGYHGDQDHAITPYRDYVIKSFNDNLRFDQFTIEQLAGDLLPNPTMWQRVATGYNRVLQTSHEGGIQDGEYLAKHQADRVRNFSEVWLAASMGCAECHDHKFDPFTQEDFYTMAAFFADVDHYGSFVKVGKNTLPTQRPPEMLAWTLPVFEKAQKLDQQIAKLGTSVKPLKSAAWEKRRYKIVELKMERAKLEGEFVPTMITVARKPREVRILPRGNWMDKSGKVVEPRTPHFLSQIKTDGRRATRLDLAKWLVDGDNPLTARVVCNRLWQRFFGSGLSKSVIDLGSQGQAPENLELLDWLALEFVESGWDVKHIVRLIVTSNAYRQSSLPRPDVDEIDPDNRCFARQSSHRLDAEQIRDGTLAVSGLLDDRQGGDFSRPYQPTGYYSALNFPEREYEPSTKENQFRRAVYVHWQRQFLHPWLLAFDAPTREECTAQRSNSNTPSAALVLLNDPTFVEGARALASRVLSEIEDDDEARIRWAWRTVLSRDPHSEEILPLAKLLELHRAEFAADPSAAKALIEIGLSKHPSNVDVAELAAWTSVCRALLNLNETLNRP